MNRRRTRSTRSTPLQPCGTEAAYHRHLRHGEKACEPCRKGAAERRRKRTANYPPRPTAPAIRPGMFCRTCSAAVPRGRSKYCSVECKRFDHATVRKVWIRNCDECGVLYVGRLAKQRMCGNTCARKRRNRSDARSRWKNNWRRSAERLTDITPRQDAELRRRARKCKLCGVYMTNKPKLPNSKELDHIVPVNVGGTHTHGNVRIICRLCNLKRPKDGSDYNGPITLWSAIGDVVTKPPPKVKVVVEKPLRPCACGKPITHSKASRCHDCTVELGCKAADLRRSGMSWQEVCEALDYRSGAGSLYGIASRYGQQPVTVLR